MKNIKRQAYSYFYCVIVAILAGFIVWSTASFAQQRSVNDALEKVNKDLQVQLAQANRLIEDQQVYMTEYLMRIEQLDSELENAKHEIGTLRESLAVYDENRVVSVAAPRYLDIPLDEDLQDYIYSLCCAYGTDEMYELIYAVIKRESQFDAAAISPTNDYGLMQINIGNHNWLSSELGIVDFLDPYENVHAGVYMLSSLIHKYEYNLPDALMAYNMGERSARKLWSRGVHTTPYADQILDYYAQFIGNI